MVSLDAARKKQSWEAWPRKISTGAALSVSVSVSVPGAQFCFSLSLLIGGKHVSLKIILAREIFSVRALALGEAISCL